MNYRTNRSSRLVGLLIAVLMAVAVNGAVLWKFDAVAQDAMLSQGMQSPVVVRQA